MTRARVSICSESERAQKVKTTEKRPDRIYKYVDSQTFAQKRKREQGDDNGDLIGVHTQMELAGVA